MSASLADINVDYRPLMGQLVGATEAAERLGVDVRSLYAYVSRGSLTRMGSDSRRRSQYDSDEIELLARRARPRTRSRPGVSIDVVVGSSVCALADGQIRYRGHDAIELAARPMAFETVAQLLWTGELDGEVDWTLPAPLRRAVTRVLNALPPATPVLDRMAAALCATSGALGAAVAEGASPDGEKRTSAMASRLVMTLAEAASQHVSFDHGSGDLRTPIARRLWERLSALQAAKDRVAAVDCALVLLADHELATSTLAVRIATSARAHLTGALLAGLGALSGAAHAGAADGIHRALLASKASRTGWVPTPVHGYGFGQSVHRSGDPRTAPLLAAVRRIATPKDRHLIEAILAANADSPPPNVDFALGALCFSARMQPGAASAIFAVARSAGWIAHAAEELDEAPLRYRARAIAR